MGLIAMLKIIVAVIVAAIAVPLAITLIQFNRKRLHIIRCAEAANGEQLEAIYAQVERLGNEAPSCADLARTNRRSGIEEEWIVPVPSYVEAAAGRVICADVGAKVEFRFSASSASEPVLRGKVYRIVPVPRHQTKTGKARNQFSPMRYMAGNLPLLAALKAVCPSYPAELLSFLLASGLETFEFDSINQARLGGSPAWVQDAEFPNCDQCKKRMSLILQLPGAMLPGRSEGTFFFFGCVKHPESTKTIAQFS